MRYVLILLGLMYANVAEAIDCKTPPDCASLGYSKENDPNCAPNGYMYCVYDTSYKKCVQHNCEGLGFTTSDKTSWCDEIIKCQDNEDYTLCNCLKPRCNIGDVFYADGSCGDVSEYESDSGKTPVGVVYYTDCSGGGKVINLHDLGRSSSSAKFNPQKPYDTAYEKFTWGSYRMGISDLKDWTCSNVTGDHDNEFWSAGKSYTDIIVKALGDSSLQYAAGAAKAFYPPDVEQNDSKVGQGHWYLPTLGELMDLYGYNYQSLGSSCIGTTGANGNTKTAVNTTLTTLKGKGVMAETLTNDYYWSSSEYHSNDSWVLKMTNGYRSYNGKAVNYYVRASLEF